MSSRIKSGRSFWIVAKARSPVGAGRTLYPSLVNIPASSRRFSGVSSTTKIDFFGFIYPSPKLGLTSHHTQNCGLIEPTPRPRLADNDIFRQWPCQSAPYRLTPFLL